MASNVESSYHVPVLYREVIDGLNIKKNGLIIDGTLGGGGHTELILSQNKSVKVIAFDRDSEAINFATKRLEKYKSRFSAVHSNFKNMVKVLKEKNIKADGVLLDLGVSSHQIDDPARGFSFRFDSALDMRMDTTDELTARDVVNHYKEEKLVQILSEYGEERYSKRVARGIVSARPINSTGELKRAVEDVVNKINKKETASSVQRVFQAIRIEVNHELDNLYDLIVSLPEILNKGARIAIIAFHSLEDRIVKRAFSELTTECVCPPKIPVCVCGHKRKASSITRKPITASEEELSHNSRSSCAKLRIVEII